MTAFFFLSVDADKAVITGDGVTIDDDGNVTVIDEGDNEVTLHKADGGYWFSLDDTEVNASTTFLLPLASTVNDTDETANSVTLRMRAGHGIDTNSARRDAETKEQMVFVWSSNGDALHYGIHLEWVTNDESKKYTQSNVTTSRNSYYLTYKASLQTSSVSYAAGQMEIRLPYYLWQIRSSSYNYWSYMPAPALSIPKSPSTSDTYKLNYTVDTHGTNDPSDDEIVITNTDMIPAGTNITWTTQYRIWPYYTIDLSQAVIQANCSCVSNADDRPELYTSNSISYRIDTGFTGVSVSAGSSNLSSQYYKPNGFPDELWDPGNYRYFKMYVSTSVSGASTPVRQTLTFTGTDGMELITETRKSTYSNPEYALAENNQTSGDWSDDVYVRYPIGGGTGEDGDTFKLHIHDDAVAWDDDTHTPPEDLNDVHTDDYDVYDDAGRDDKTLTWKAYSYVPPTTRGTFYKERTSSLPYVEALQADGYADAKWHLYGSYNGWDLQDGEMQKLTYYDDALYWEYSDLLTDVDYEIEYVSEFHIYYTDIDRNTGQTLYPDVEAGSVTVEGYKDGQWEIITQ